MTDEKISAFADMIRESKNIVFFGGAGVSSAHVIPAESPVSITLSPQLYDQAPKYRVSPPPHGLQVLFRRRLKLRQ